MLFKISLSNIRKSIKDYAVYFFTLVLGVAVFYVFNAIETQTAFIRVNETQREMIKILTTAVSGVSVFVAVVLGLLIVYASRFLMKRRNKEFALYMMLGMSKWKISALLLCETVIVWRSQAPKSRRYPPKSVSYCSFPVSPAREYPPLP